MPSDPNVRVTINTDPSYGPPRAWCSICQQMIKLDGPGRTFSHHYYPDTTVMIGCEGSGYTPDEVDQIIRERRPVPGRYVRPHP